MFLNRLDWDSEFFKLNIGIVRIKEFSSEIEMALKEIGQSNFDLTYLYSKSFSDNPFDDLLIQDTKLVYRKRASNLTSDNVNVVSYDGDVNQELIDLTMEAGINSRYKLDPKLAPFFKDFYMKWLENSLNRSYADDVLVVKNKQGILGFITLRKEDETSASIGLISVNKDSQGMGIGKAMIIAAENWVSSMNLQYLKVATQKSNSNACLFYQKMGFDLFDTDYIFHIWKKNNN